MIAKGDIAGETEGIKLKLKKTTHMTKGTTTKGRLKIYGMQ